MIRPIDANALIAEYDRVHVGPPGRARKLIENAPTIEPGPQWIPVTERLPEERDAGILKKLGTSKLSDDVLITVDVKGERMTDVGCTYDGVWQWIHEQAFPDWAVIAWMPLPEPYEEVTT